MASRATVHRTSFGAGDVVWREFGEGPALVLMHGGFGSWLHWYANIDALSQRYRVLLPDLPGLGDSDRPPEPYDGPSIAALVVQGIRTLVGAGEPLHLVGFSFGGVIGGHVAADLGEHATSMTFVGAGGMGLTRPPRRKMTSWRAAGTPAGVMSAHRHNLAALMLEKPASIDDVALHIQWLNTLRARTKSAPISLRSTLPTALAATPVALGGIWGELDITSHGYLEEREAFLRGLQSDAPFAIIPDAGHWVMYEAPDAFNRTLLGILAGAEARAGRLRQVR